MAEAIPLNWENLPSGTEDREDRTEPGVSGQQQIPLISSQPEKQVSLTPTIKPLNEELATKRATMAHFGTGDLTGKSYDDYMDALQKGQEDALRQETARSIEAQDRARTLQSIINNPNASKSLLGAMIFGGGVRPQEKESVFENFFASKYMDRLHEEVGYNYKPFSSAFSDEVANNPTQVKQITDFGKDILAKKLRVQTAFENAGEAVHNQSWMGYFANLGTDLITLGLYGEVRPRWGQGGPFWAGKGTALDDIWHEAYRLPDPEFNSWLKGNTQRLSNDPQMLHNFLQAGIGVGSDEKTFNNVMTYINVGSLLPYKTTISAVKGMLTASPALFGTRSTAGVAAAGMGHMEEAAIRNGAVRLTALEQGSLDQVRDSLDSLVSGMKTHVVGEGVSAGNYGQALENLLNEYYDNISTPLKKLFEEWRVDRMPGVARNEVLLRAIREETRLRFPHLNDSILDMRYRMDPASNTYWWDVQIGRTSTEMFETEGEARGFAKTLNLPLVSSAEEEIAKLGDRPKSKVAAAKYDDRVAEIQKNANIYKQGATIEPAGARFYIAYPINIDLRGQAVISAIAPENERIAIRTFGDVLNSLTLPIANVSLGAARTPEETVLGRFTMAERKIATFGPSKWIDLLRTAMKPIAEIAPGVHPMRQGLNKKWDQFERTLNAMQTEPNPDIPGAQGRFFKTPDEMELYYRQKFGRSPDIDEQQAYSAWKMLNEMDRMFRTVSVVRDQTNAGIQTHQIITKGKPFQGPNRSPFFEGKRLPNFPGGKDERVLFVWSDGSTSTRYIDKLPSAERDKLNKRVTEGKGVAMELWNGNHLPLEGYGELTGEDVVRYVYSEAPVESRPISWVDKVPRQGGGHLGEEYPVHLKRAIVTKDPKASIWRYGLDVTVGAGYSEADLNILAKHLNEAERLFKAGDEAGARAYMARNNVPIPADEFLGGFKPQTNPVTGRRTVRFAGEEPFRVVPAGRRIGELDAEMKIKYEKRGGFVDGTKDSLSSQSSVEFTGQRDAYDYKEYGAKGSPANPLWNVAPVKHIDALSMLTRAGDRITNSLYMDDIKALEAQRWLKNAEKYMKDGEKIWYTPWAVFHNPEEHLIAGMDKATKQMLMDDWNKINLFTGQLGKWRAFLDSTNQKLADMVYGKFSPQLGRWIGNKESTLSPAWLIPKITNGPQALRSFVYHEKMGLFNVPQFFVHAFTFVNVAAVAGPARAGQGAVASLLHFWSTVNKTPEFLETADRIAQKFGWRPGEWKEAREKMLSTGIKNFEGEHYLKDSPYGANIIKTAGRQVLDAGGMFFRGGARSVRVASYYTAYKEFRDGPTALGKLFSTRTREEGVGKTGWKGNLSKLTRDDEAEILQRADLLSHNMSRASTSILQKGMLSFGSQFAGYNYRLLEMLTGKRLTQPERLRLFGTYWAIYGLPATAGLVGLDASMRQSAYDHGYVIGDNFTRSFMNEGLLSVMMATFTSKDWNPKNGIWYNPNERYGAHDLELAQKMMETDSSVAKVLGGAVYQEFSYMWESGSSFYRWMNDWIRGTGEYQMTVQDALTPLKGIASFNALDRFYHEFMHGRQLTRKGAFMEGDVGKMDALYRLFTGLQNMKAADAFVMAKLNKHYEENWKTVEKEASEEMHRAFEARLENNERMSQIYMMNARRILMQAGYPEEKFGHFFGRAMEEHPDLIQRIWQQFKDKSPADSFGLFTGQTTGKREQRNEQYRKQLGF